MLLKWVGKPVGVVPMGRTPPCVWEHSEQIAGNRSMPWNPRGVQDRDLLASCFHVAAFRIDTI